MRQELLKGLKELNVVERGTFALHGGNVTDFYVDIKKAYGNPEIFNYICDAVWEEIDGRATCVAGMGYGGEPLATALSLSYGLNLVLLREQPKTHGRIGYIDGHVPTKEDRVVIVDDVATKGETLKKAIEIIGQTGAEILGCHVVVKRGEVKLDIPFHYLFTAEDLL